MNCPICKKPLAIEISGNGMWYCFCLTKSKKHIFEIGPYKTEKGVKKIIKEVEKTININKEK
jgi:hypothetical protein